MQERKKEKGDAKGERGKKTKQRKGCREKEASENEEKRGNNKERKKEGRGRSGIENGEKIQRKKKTRIGGKDKKTRYMLEEKEERWNENKRFGGKVQEKKGTGE